MDLDDDVSRLLQEFDVLRHASDLDLLVFLARHPRALLTSEQMVRFLGYGPKDVAASLERLLDAGLLTRTPNSRHAARMYVLAAMPPGADWLPSLLRLATQRSGRLALMRAISHRSSQAAEPSLAGAGREKGVAPPLPFPKPRIAVESDAQPGVVAADRSGMCPGSVPDALGSRDAGS
jgi:DNA-binding MarR family transcriptional regulator